MIEALYFGKPMLGFPQNHEQRPVAYRMKLLGAAQVKEDSDTSQDLADKIRGIAGDSPERQITEWVSREMKYTEEHG